MGSGSGSRLATRYVKASIVCAGYLLAIGVAWMAGYLYNLRMAAMPYDTSGGMYAGGELLTELTAFLGVALVPTLLGLWFVRGHQRLWQAVAVASLTFAVIGLLGVVAFFLAARDPANPGLLLFSLVGLAQLLGVPLWTFSFALFAVLAPTGRARRTLIVAIGVELVIGVCAAFHWLVGAHI